MTKGKSLYDEYVEYTQKFKREYGDLTMVLIEVGSFWEIYDCDQHKGADMKLVSEILNIQVTKKNKNIPQVSSSNPLMAGFPSHALNRFLPLLLDADLTIVLVGQVTSPPNPERAVTQILSKGTYIDCFDITNSNYILSCTSIVNGHLGASLIDLSTGTSIVFEGNIDNFVKILHMYKPCEIILERDDTFFKGIQAKKYLLKEYFTFNLPSQIEILLSVFENDSMLSIIEYLDMEKTPYALISYVAMIEFCKKHVPHIVRRLRKPIKSNTEQLDVFYNTNEQLDVYGLNKVLNSCVTAMGRRYFKHRLLNPFCKIELIEQSLFKIEKMSIDVAQKWKSSLSNVYDLERLFRRVELGTASIRDMENIGKSCICIPEGKHIFQHILDTYDFENGIVKNDKELDTILANINEINQHVETLIAKFNQLYGVQYFKIDFEKDGWFIYLTSKRWQEIQKHPQCDFTSQKSMTSQKSTTIKVTNSTLEELFIKSERLQTELKIKAAAKFDQSLVLFNDIFKDSFTEIIHIICDLDFTSTCVINNNKFKYVHPDLHSQNDAYADFKGIRHPIIEIINDSEEYVGNDLVVSGGTLLYGLNASGKSSLMKAVGLNIIMAQCGMYVAATSLTLSPYESIFARISKSDNMYAGQSTFMIEMSELRKILKYSSNKSLILADELCAGTESVSAISIVAAGIKTLYDKKSSFIFTTHLHELTKIKIVPPCVNIFHLDTFYDKTNDLLVYNRKLCKGQGSELYGLEVCKSLDLDPSFLSVAEEVRSKLTKSVSRKSKYNAKLVVNKCSICKESADEVHHIKEQRLADKDGYIGNFHKNKLFNLTSICKECHDKIHNQEIKVDGYKMTSKGRNLIYQNT